ncbi:MAG: hypothetical protein HQ534_10675, partial [Armatimonadetes bacterium]|nr:hypothetical protein [Armatimonadota bacterium]
MHSVVNEKGLVVIFDDFTVSVSDIRWNNVYFYLEDLESYFENEITSSINSFLPKDSSIVLIPLSKFAEMYGNPVVEDVDPVELVESVISSFPFNYSFNYRENGNFDNLVVNVDLLPGYNEPGKESIYLSGNPTLPSTDNILDKAGISTVGTWPFPLIDYQNTLDWDDEIYNYCADVGAGMGLNYIRLGAKWNIVIPSVDEVNPVLIDNFPEITSPDINDYISEITAISSSYQDNMIGWNYMDALINSAKNNGLEPMIMIGQGHSDKPPRYNGKTINPGTIKGIYPENYEGVDPQVYLYYLEKYARAVVRKYKSDVKYWFGDCELNAARFCESYDWWRKGSAWERDSFQDSVIMVLSKAVHDEDPTDGQFIQAFHVFELAKRLDEWKDYYDIVGLQFYPNEIYLNNASPVLGFLVSELVYSTRRALDVLNKDAKVWITETGYPSTTTSQLDSTASLSDHLNHFSQAKQDKYFRDLFYGCSRYGTDGILWFLLVENEDNRYGLIESNGNEKNTYYTYKNEFSGYPDPVWVEFNTEYENGIEDLPGHIAVNHINSSIGNHEEYRLFQTKEYTAQVLEKKLERPSNGDEVYHNRWNNEPFHYTLDKIFIPNNNDEKQQLGQYSRKVPILFSDGPDDEPYKLSDIQIRDPWNADVDGSQDNELRSLDTTIYKVFLNQNMQQDNSLPDYSIKALGAIATQTDIKIFTGWEAWQNGIEIQDISQSSDKIWIVSTYNRETKIVVKDENIELKPRYETSA